MKELADGLFEVEIAVEGYPPNVVNAYLIGDVVVDAATRFLAGQILAELEGFDVRAHAITHGHADHQGGSHAICEALSLPFLCPAVEADALESGDILPLVPDNEVNRQLIEMSAGPGHPVARRLREGDEVGGFVAIETPGHSPGHISYWRESDRALIVGDVLSNRNYSTMEVGLHEPFPIFTVDPDRNRASIRKLAALEPALLCFGHGPPVTDPAELRELVARLDREPAVRPA